MASLARLVGVSRNSLYRYHPDAVVAVRRLALPRRARRSQAKDNALQALKLEIEALRDQVSKLATLADHYYAAATEARVLLSRREREISSLRAHLRASPVRIHP
ncbi:MAG: hypothetical protein ACREUT_12450 [Steroidobacteraceae bacterium]